MMGWDGMCLLMIVTCGVGYFLLFLMSLLPGPDWSSKKASHTTYAPTYEFEPPEIQGDDRLSFHNGSNLIWFYVEEGDYNNECDEVHYN